MEIPKIGGAKGIFEIFVPGTFLVINLLGGIFILSFPRLKSLNSDSLELFKIFINPISIIVFLICFGYLTGMILRLLRPEKPDKKSKTKNSKKYKSLDTSFYTAKFPYISWSKHLFEAKSHPKKSRKIKECIQLDKSFYTSEFPYISWFRHLFETRNYPKKSRKIFEELWLPGENNINGKPFFNFYKLIICYNDSNAASEIFATESVTRYITGIYYSLRISIYYFIGIAIVLMVDSLFSLHLFYNSMQMLIIIVLIAILITYHVALQRIITNFRLIRIKEVESVILGSINNYQLIINKLDGK